MAQSEAVEEKRGRGRPVKYTGSQAEKIVSVLREHGLTGGQAFLVKTGIQVKPGAKKSHLKISLPTLAKLAKAGGVEFQRGRPKVEEAQAA